MKLTTMFLRKLRSVALMAAGRNKYKLPFSTTKYKLEQAGCSASTGRSLIYYSLFLFLSIWLLFILFFSSSPNTIHPPDPSSQQTTVTTAATTNIGLDDRKVIARPSLPAVCSGSVSVYVYDLPEKFNLGLLQDCEHLNVYMNMCPHVANNGLGQALSHMVVDDDDDHQLNMKNNWFATNQFMAEMLFHARVENHPCRTWEPDHSTLFYVPFYGGLHASSKVREADLAVRDRLAMELVEYLSQQQPWWGRKQGRDHFLAVGRTAWDFMRSTGVDFGANSLLNLPEVKNMSVLTVERHPWQGSNQYGIPYPSYFHPSTSDEMVTWQNKIRLAQRPHLFSFIGAPRTSVQKAAIRDEILRQCNESTRCNLLNCGGSNNKCHSPREVIRVMSRSEFCMQAPGDSFTRRSTFDSVLAGCIPVFFSPHTAYTQYGWYLPEKRSEYSVYIPEERWKWIEEELRKIPRDKVERMRRTVIDLIPRLTYKHPKAATDKKDLPDAVDIALAQLSKHVMQL